jgi:DNA-binding NtrC family response regulator
VFLEELIPPTIKAYASQHHPERSHTPAPATVDPHRLLAETLVRYGDDVSSDLSLIARETERILICHTINRERGVKLRAARLLGINRVTLDRKLHEYGIHVKRGRGVVSAHEADPTEADEMQTA